MYLIVSVPSSNSYQKPEEQIIQEMETRGYTMVGLATGVLNCRDLEFETKQIVEDEQIELLESDLRQLIENKELKIYVED